MPDARHITGQRGEFVAAAHLQAAGWQVVARNWRCPQGELDLIVRRGDVLAFVEVRTHSTGSRSVVPPEQSVGLGKQARLERAASAWLAEQPAFDAVVRFDVVAVHLGHDDDTTVEHFESAFEPRWLVL